jgi:hypothetical protein
MDYKKRFLKSVTELRVFVMLLGFLTMALTDVCGTTYYTVASGDISGDIWSTSPTGTPGPLPALVDGDIINIDDNITITTNFQAWQDILLTINLNSTIEISGQLSLSTNSTVVFLSSSAKIISLGGGNSDKIKFGNDNTWSGNDGDLTGPGTLDKNYDPDTSPLPIQLLFFKVNRVEKSLILEWSTASELNFDYFSVERSSNGTDFKEIFQIKGHGTTNERNDYKVLDNQPLIGKNYYRLKSVDYDLTFEYSPVVVAESKTDKQVVVYPNPAVDRTINVRTNFSPQEGDRIEIYNNLGLKLQEFDIIEYENALPFNDAIKQGAYLLRYVSPTHQQVVRFYSN